MHRQSPDTVQTLLVGEGHLLELVCTGMPLPCVLDNLCSAFDLEVGEVVSTVLFPDDQEHSMHTIARSAADFGLSVFFCAAILSPRGELLATFESYCYTPRTPISAETKLIEQLTQLAA